MNNTNKKEITYQESVFEGAKILKDYQIESYMIDSRVLFCFVMKISIEKLIGYPETVIEKDEFDKFFSLITRRKNKEPISYIIGNREFRGLDFKVNSTTLDPRSDSETLIELVLKYYNDKKQNLKIIDLGTGSGCLLLSLLNEFPNACGLGVDISEEALKVANYNAKNLGLANRSEFVLKSWCRGIEQKFDIIISNPPYIKTCEIANLQPEVSFYEPKSALDGGNTGLQCYLDIAKDINLIANINSMAFFEFGIGQEIDVKNIFINKGFKFESFKKDLAGITRCISLTKI